MMKLFKGFIDEYKELEQDPHVRPVHGFRVWLLTLILLGAFIGFTTPVFVWLNVPTFTGSQIILTEFQKNTRSQGVHFLGGVLLGYMFSHPATGLSFGLLKEFVDLIGFTRSNALTFDLLVKTIIDIAFWTGGGLIGFYLLANVQYALQKNKIYGLKDLTFFTIKKMRAKKDDAQKPRP